MHFPKLIHRINIETGVTILFNFISCSEVLVITTSVFSTVIRCGCPILFKYSTTSNTGNFFLSTRCLHMVLSKLADKSISRGILPLASMNFFTISHPS